MSNSARFPAEEAGTKKHQTGDVPSMRGRKAAWESRATEFRQRLIPWKQTPESMRPSLRALATKLGTTHQILSYHLNRLDRWQAEERAKQIRARAKAEGREMTLRECCDVIITPGFFRQIEELRLAAKRGPLNHWQIKMLKMFAKRGFSGAREILGTCRQMTPQEERQARAAERAAGFAAAATKTIERIRQDARRWFADYVVELPTLPVSPKDKAVTRISEQILDYLRRSKEPRTREEIEANAKGKTVHKRSALKSLFATGRVVETGAGSKGDPLRYRTREQESQKPA